MKWAGRFRLISFRFPLFYRIHKCRPDISFRKMCNNCYRFLFHRMNKFQTGVQKGLFRHLHSTVRNHISDHLLPGIRFLPAELLSGDVFLNAAQLQADNIFPIFHSACMSGLLLLILLLQYHIHNSYSGLHSFSENELLLLHLQVAAPLTIAR